ncbi:DUF1445 [Papiliotrema laurentii]|uniref:DUF1445 n=1 Tax=Papiliotrema laurentii TaxID=5418 RepID=A0AAD9FPJ8_PAPLA|nr:DUF1445 [Papiliotrema laurentii]
MTLTQYPDALSVRVACRRGAHKSHTAGLAPRHLQANLLIIPKAYATDFRRLCQRNPVACPLLAESPAPGNVGFAKHIAKDIDIRFDAPAYNIYENGKLVKADVPSIEDYWTEDSVAFLIGCSFSFEGALSDAGLVPRHVELDRNVPMYRTTLALMPSGVFEGNIVVSMRPCLPEDIPYVREITSAFDKTHGCPIAWGHDAPARLGIADINRPDFGDPPVLRPGEVPVFWGCGVTPQLSVMSSPALTGVAISHSPGKMVLLDYTVDSLRNGGQGL